MNEIQVAIIIVAVFVGSVFLVGIQNIQQEKKREKAKKEYQELIAKLCSEQRARKAAEKRKAALAQQQREEARRKWEAYLKKREEEEKREKKEIKTARRSYTQGVFAAVRDYQDTLIQKYNQTVFVDDFGETIYDDFFKEILSFVLNVIPKKYDKFAEYDDDALLFDFYIHINPIKTTPMEYNETSNRYFQKVAFRVEESDEALGRKQATLNIIVKYLEFIIRNGLTSTSNNTKKVNTPIDYEKQIAADLRKLGFNARATKASGDQGADVLATKNGVSFAIQCKMYSKPVSNKAVQEANAGRDFYKKDYGVVVSNAFFTKSARQAAQACGIILLNDNQLSDLLKYVNPDGK